MTQQRWKVAGRPFPASWLGALPRTQGDQQERNARGYRMCGLFVVLDLAVTWTNYAVLISLGSEYAQAVDDAGQAAVVAAATYPSAVLESGLLFVYNTLVLAVGILITGFVMLKGVFGRPTAIWA